MPTSQEHSTVLYNSQRLAGKRKGGVVKDHQKLLKNTESVQEGFYDLCLLLATAKKSLFLFFPIKWEKMVSFAFSQH